MPHHGHLIISIPGPYLSNGDRKILSNELLAGVILFSRNYINKSQITELCAEIRSINPDLLLFVDQEGGVVQRFKHNGFDKLPSIRFLGNLLEQGVCESEVLEYSRSLGFVMAASVREVGVDISFAPVLDAPSVVSSLLENRVFHNNPKKVLSCARAYIEGMQAVNMPATGKHYPGHGGVKEDSHFCMPEDNRSIKSVMQDIEPFSSLISENLPAVMAAHVTYPQFDNEAAGFSRFWLKDMLRNNLGFKGVVFSDDIMMKGAFIKGPPIMRSIKSIEAGCDYIIICNNNNAIHDVLENSELNTDEGSLQRRINYYQKYKIDEAKLSEILSSRDYVRAQSLLKSFEYKLSTLNQIVAH
jgi:beta-N-acetylhexosaminidase